MQSYRLLDQLFNKLTVSDPNRFFIENINVKRKFTKAIFLRHKQGTNIYVVNFE